MPPPSGNSKSELRTLAFPAALQELEEAPTILDIAKGRPDGVQQNVHGLTSHDGVNPCLRGSPLSVTSGRLEAGVTYPTRR